MKNYKSPCEIGNQQNGLHNTTQATDYEGLKTKQMNWNIQLKKTINKQQQKHNVIGFY